MAVVVASQGCGRPAPGSPQDTAQTRQAVSGDGGADAGVAADPLPCAASSFAAIGNTGNVIINSGSVVDSYQSRIGAYGGSNVGNGAIVQAATTITNNGGTVNGTLRQNAAGGFAVVPVPAGARNLPLGSANPGDLNINGASDSITLPPGDYVAANINVNFPGAINLSPAGRVRIWVTGNLNLGGNENRNGVAGDLAFLVTSSGWVNVNSRGALYGVIYAPTSGVNLNSSVFGLVVGSAVTLNSGAAIHFDQSSTCVQISATPVPAGLHPLPAPPTQVGCYVFTLNSWVPVQCMEPATVLPGFQHFDVGANGLGSFAFSSGGVAQPAVPFVYGQVEATVAVLDSETDSDPNCKDATTCFKWGVQTNSNFFPCQNGNTGNCWVQFVAAGDGVHGATAVCIETWQFTPRVVTNFCIGANGQTVINPNGLFTVTTRKGSLQAGDFANVAGYSYTVNGAPLVAAVAQFSWVSNQDVVPQSEIDVLNRVPGLYAVVAPDQYGLSKGWTGVTGSIIGMANTTEAKFDNAEVVTRVAASNCQGDVSVAGPTCPGQPTLSATNVLFAPDNTTGETNNLTLTQTPTPSFPNPNLAVTTFVATTNAPPGSGTASCLSSLPSHLYIRDHEGDSGGVPSNVGAVPFWNSPDIFVVPHDTAKPSTSDTPADLELTAGQVYDVYLRVHNEYGCNDVQGPIDVFIDAADPNMGFANWRTVTPGSDVGQYTSFGSASMVIAPAYGAGIVGPFSWKPDDGGHKCLLAAIAAGNESKPPASKDPPVLPPAYMSNQIAQRNLQIGDGCTYSITNSATNSVNLPTSANLVLGVSVTPAKPVPNSAGGPTISLSFEDPSSALFNAWSSQRGLIPSHSGTSTTIVLDQTSHIALNAVSLAAGQSPSVSINIVPAPDLPPPSVDVSAILTDPITGNIIQENGGTCQSVGRTIVVK